MDGMRSIRYFSFLNDFLDFVVVVPAEFEERSCEVIRSALDMFWDDQYETYGDSVENELALADIPFEIHYMPWDHDRDCAVDEAAWETWLEELSEKYPMTVLN